MPDLRSRLMMGSGHGRRFPSLFLVLSLIAAPAFGAEAAKSSKQEAAKPSKEESAKPKAAAEEKDKGEKDKGEKEPALRFTDDDLWRFHRDEPPPRSEDANDQAAAPAPPGAPDWVKANQEKEKATRDKEIQEAKARIAAIEPRLDYLRKKRMAVLDPFSIMPQSPTGEDEKRDAGLKPQELLEQIDAEIKKLEEDLAQQRSRLTTAASDTTAPNAEQ